MGRYVRRHRDLVFLGREAYGTVILIAASGTPAPRGDTAGTLAPWLREHPRGQVLVRDRSQAYAEGARQGAPAAIPVADRVHLLQNLREALDQVCITHSPVLDAVNDTIRRQPVLEALAA